MTPSGTKVTDHLPSQAHSARCVLSDIVIKGMILAFSAVAIVWWTAPSALAQVNETIDDYQVSVTVNRDSSLSVRELITINFRSNPRKGIFRTIPLKYQLHGRKRSITVSHVSISNSQNIVQTFHAFQNDDNFHIEILHQNESATDIQTYEVRYTIQRSLINYSDRDELVLSLIRANWVVLPESFAIVTELSTAKEFFLKGGHLFAQAWAIPILRASYTIQLPSVVSKNQIQAACFVEADGQVRSDCDVILGGALATQFYLRSPLLFGQSFTVSEFFPKNIVLTPSLDQRTRDKHEEYWIFVIPLFTFVFMVVFWFILNEKTKRRNPIIVQYDVPNSLTPAEVGTILRNRVEKRAIWAEIIFLANCGYIKIIREIAREGPGRKKYDYRIIKMREFEDLKNRFDQRLMGFIFRDGGSVTLSSLMRNQVVGMRMSDVKRAVYSTITAKGYFAINPLIMRRLIFAFAIVMADISSLILFMIIKEASGIFSGMLAGAIIACFAPFVSSISSRGLRVKEHIIGLKEYLRVAEKARLEFHNAPRKNPEHFEKLLPFAVALCVENQWAAHFEDIYNFARPDLRDDKGVSVTYVSFLKTIFGSVSANQSNQSRM